MKYQLISDGEIPYKTLSRLGLTRAMVEDLPLRVLEDLQAGLSTPVLPLRVSDGHGGELQTRGRLSLFRTGETVDVLVMPEKMRSTLDRFTSAERARLESGETLVADVERPNGGLVRSYVQIDPGTRQVLSVPVSAVAHNIESAAYGLSPEGQQALKEGRLHTFQWGKYPQTLGISLTQDKALLLCSGDAEAWRERQKKPFEQYTFGVSGCWVMDDEGHLDYVSEEDYTEELWEEQRKAGTRHVQAYMHRK